MPGKFNCPRLAGQNQSMCRHFRLFVPFLYIFVGCNGQTEFMEQRRALDREVRVGVADVDSLRTKSESEEGTPSISPIDDRDVPLSGTVGVFPQELSLPAGSPLSENRHSNRDEDEVVNDGEVQQGRGVPEVQAPSVEVQVPPVEVQVPPVEVQIPPVDVQVPPRGPTQVPPHSPVANKPRAGEVVRVQLTQPRAQADILWAVDNSGSMAWAQEQLKNKFQSFAQKLKDTRIDFQIAVTSLDVCKVDEVTGYPIPDALCPDARYIPDGIKISNKVVGPLRGGLQMDPISKRSILRDSSDFIQAFQRTALLGTKGSAFEHGLWAAKLAVQKALEPKGENKGFIRREASLSVVILSDEEDDGVQMWCEDGYGRTSTTADGKKDLNLCKEGGRSPYLDAFGVAPFALMKNSKGIAVTNHKYTADDFKNWLSDSAVKGERNFRVSAITGLRGSNGQIDCALSSGGPVESGTNYIRAAQLTGGAIENICSSDWSNVLAHIGQNTVELATRISLPPGKQPFEGTLIVQVDGQSLLPSQYSYDKSLHAVVFAIPPAMGTEVVVSYRETLVD